MSRRALPVAHFAFIAFGTLASAADQLAILTGHNGLAVVAHEVVRAPASVAGIPPASFVFFVRHSPAGQPLAVLTVPGRLANALNVLGAERKLAVVLAHIRGTNVHEVAVVDRAADELVANWSLPAALALAFAGLLIEMAVNSQVFALELLIVIIFLGGGTLLLVQPRAALLQPDAFNETVLLGRLAGAACLARLLAPGVFASLRNLVQWDQPLVVLVDLFVAQTPNLLDLAADKEEKEEWEGKVPEGCPAIVVCVVGVVLFIIIVE